MANAMLNPTLQDEEDPLVKQPVPKPTQPTVPAVPASPGIPLPQTGAQTGAQTIQPPANQPVVQAQNNSPDPMAFTNTIAPTTGPANTNPVPTNTGTATVQPAPVMNNPGAAYNPFLPENQPKPGPLFGGDQKKINEYWAKQGIPVAPSALGVQSTGVGSNGVNTYDPDAVKAAQANLVAGNDPEVAAMLAQLKTGAANSTVSQSNALADKANAEISANDRARLDAAYLPDAANLFKTNVNGATTTTTPGDALSTATANITPTVTPVPPPAQGNKGGLAGGVGLTPRSGTSTQTGTAPLSPLSPTDAASQTAQSATNGPNNGVSLSMIDPSNSLISQQIQPGHDVDRVKTFQDALNSTIKNVIDPSYEASARDLNRYNFGAGRGVSGQARTSQGNLADTRERRIADLAAQGLAGATTGSIDDYYKNIGVAQQQQGFQKDLSDTAFNQAVTGSQLEDYLTNSAFNRAATQSQIGEANNPSNIALILSQIFGNQSSEAGKAAAQLFGNLGNRSGQNGGNTGGVDIQALLEFLNKQRGGATAPVNNGGYVEQTP